jgi:hypothetical protein
MTTFRTKATRSITLRRREARTVAALLCCLAVRVSSAAEPIHATKTTHHGQRSSPATELVGKLTRLRDLTIKSFFPTQSFGVSPLNWDDDTAVQFDAAHQLFKPVDRESYSDTLKKIVNQQSGLQIGPNTQFQFDFQRYWTVDDRQEVSVRMGLHFDFR